jgi:predicted nucleotidyltransferase
MVMKTRKEVEKIIKNNKSFLKKNFKVEEIGIFGSYARNEQSKDSDIDILVKFSDVVGWEFIDLKEYLEKILGLKVDLVTIKALKPQLKDSILKEVVYS